MTRPTTASELRTDQRHPDHVTEARTEEERIAQQMAQMADRLCREFTPTGGGAAETLRDQVRETWAAFGSPKVITYLPVLVERIVRGRHATAR